MNQSNPEGVVKPEIVRVTFTRSDGSSFYAEGKAYKEWDKKVSGSYVLQQVRTGWRPEPHKFVEVPAPVDHSLEGEKVDQVLREFRNHVLGRLQMLTVPHEGLNGLYKYDQIMFAMNDELASMKHTPITTERGETPINNDPKEKEREGEEREV